MRISHARYLLALSTLLLAQAARADLAPPPSECDHLPVGAPCGVDTEQGISGRCIETRDTRRNRTYHSCFVDPHECEQLAVGAPCHGYLGAPAHCAAFSDPTTHR